MGSVSLQGVVEPKAKAGKTAEERGIKQRLLSITRAAATKLSGRQEHGTNAHESSEGAPHAPVEPKKRLVSKSG